MNQIDITILQEFEQITKKPITSYLKEVVIFFSSSYNALVDYYLGNVQEVPKLSLSQLADLSLQSEQYLAVFTLNASQFKNLKWWDLLEILDEIDNRLQTSLNLNKWTRSSITKDNYSQYIQLPYVVKPNQSLERISQDILNDPNPTDDWYNIAVENDLNEEDYTAQGGALVDLKMKQLQSASTITSVVATMINNNLYGKDIDRYFHFEDEDSAVLSTEDTILQSVEILSRLKQNDNPDYPFDGLQAGVSAGVNRASLNFPVIQRQYAATFATDDSLKNFTITSLSIQQNGLLMDYTVTTQFNTIIEQQSII